MSGKLNLRSVALRKRLKERTRVISVAQWQDLISHPDFGKPGELIRIERKPKRPVWEMLGFRATRHD